MAKKLSLLIIGDSGSALKRVVISHRQSVGLLSVVFIFLIAIFGGFFQYLSMHSKLIGKQSIERQLARQTALVELQRQQLHQFAQDINELKNKLLVLNQLEEQIRNIADIDAEGNPGDLFGVGGSTPDDLDVDIEVVHDHRRLIKDMHEQIQQISDASNQQHTSFESILKQLEEQKNLLAHTPSIRPSQGWISSRFGYRKSPFSNRREFHKGLDIANHKNTPIIATADGVVTFMGNNGNFGRMIVIDHGFGVITRYAHIEKGLKQIGDPVKRGDEIALMGNTGRSTGSHVHYEVRLHGVPINPEKYIPN